MLTHLAIKQFTLVENLELDIQTGFTVITGETGAGKSILLDALGLCLGDKADAQSVRLGQIKPNSLPYLILPSSLKPKHGLTSEI
jgi:DNA repair protein RecN (Recombination protein N)